MVLPVLHLSTWVGPHSGHYYVGVALALGAALCSSLTAIIIRHISSKIDTVTLGVYTVFYTGFSGIAIVLLVSSYRVAHLVANMGSVDLYLGVPPSCPNAQPLLPNSHQPRQN